MTERKQKLYLIKNCLGLYKIGISTDPTRRVRELELNSGLDCVVVSEHETKLEARCVEKKLHRKFSKFRKNGEWFSFDDSVVEKFEKYVSHADRVVVVTSPKEVTVEDFVNLLLNYDESLLETPRGCEQLFIRQIEILNSQVIKKKLGEQVIDCILKMGYYFPLDWSQEICHNRAILHSYFCYMSIEKFPIVKLSEITRLSAMYKKTVIQGLTADYEKFCKEKGLVFEL